MILLSTIQMEVTVCTCCYRPIELCSIAQKWLAQGVPEEWITEERLFPEDVNAIDTRIHTERIERTG